MYLQLYCNLAGDPVQLHSQAVEQEVTSQPPIHSSTYRQISSVPSIPQTYSYQALPQQHYYHNSHPHGAILNGVMPETNNPPAVHQQPSIPAPPKGPADDDLPSHKIPVDSPILWQLSQDVREWKFLAQFLDLEEEVIEEIDQYIQPNKTRDKLLKKLTEWVKTLSDATRKALREVTLLYEKLVELIKSYSF